MTRFPERLPAALSGRLASAGQSIYNTQGREVDVAIGGIPFRLASDPNNPKTTETIPIRKDQVDTERDPGEQSLASWWRRSQSSFHEGAGSLYQENSTIQGFSSAFEPSNSFYDSQGIDVFTQGRMTLLKRMDADSGPTAQYGRVRTYSVNSTRINYCTNPNFEVSVANWTALSDAGTATTIVQDATHVWTGSQAMKLTFGTDDLVFPPPSAAGTFSGLPANSPYTATIMVWVPAANADGVSIVGNGSFGSTSGALRDQWVQLVLHSTTDGSGNAQVAIWPMSPLTVGNAVWIDACLVESGTTAGAYFDGASPNSAWNGTTGLSASTMTISSGSPAKSAVASGALYTGSPYTAAYSSMHAPAKTIVDGMVSGSAFYDIASDGTLYAGDVSSPGTATTWPCGATTTRIDWGKHRLWVIGPRRIWQPNLALAGGTSQAPIFTHPSQGWTYTCMAEAPTAMLFGGHDGNASSIQAITFGSDGGIPTLSGAAIVTTLPNGELVQEITTLAGTFVGIGTSRGFRIGLIDSSGSITYGPLLIEPDNVSACTALTTQDRFFVVAFRTTDGRSLAYRVDTSVQIADGVYAYAKDIDCGSVGAITSLAAVNSDVLLATTDNGGAWKQSTTNYVASGYFQSGRIRYRTNEPKSFKFLSLEIEPLNGAISVELIQEGGGTSDLGSITRQGEVSNDTFSISLEPMRYASVRLTLTPSGTSAPVVNSYLLRSLPAVAPQRMLTLPLLCLDMEQAKSGQRYGGNGYALDRLTALQILEDAAETITFQDFSLSGSAGQIVTIESIKFVQNTPSRANKADEIGGILMVQLRTIS